MVMIDLLNKKVYFYWQRKEKALRSMQPEGQDQPFSQERALLCLLSFLPPLVSTPYPGGSHEQAPSREIAPPIRPQGIGLSLEKSLADGQGKKSGLLFLL